MATYPSARRLTGVACCAGQTVVETYPRPLLRAWSLAYRSVRRLGAAVRSGRRQRVLTAVRTPGGGRAATAARQHHRGGAQARRRPRPRLAARPGGAADEPAARWNRIPVLGLEQSVPSGRTCSPVAGTPVRPGPLGDHGPLASAGTSGSSRRCCRRAAGTHRALRTPEAVGRAGIQCLQTWSICVPVFQHERSRPKSGPAAGNTQARQVRELAKINTPVTRTRRHSPAHGGTIARIGM